MMADAVALEAAVAADPDDDTPKLMLADVLDERGDLASLDRACDLRLAAQMTRVKAAPDDDGPRLEWADIAERYGRVERAEFVRVQCELAHENDIPWKYSCEARDALRKREQELLDAPHASGLCYNRTEWAGPAASLVRGDNPDPYTFRRGFVEAVTCSWPDWQLHGDAIRAGHPVREVTLTTRPDVYAHPAAGAGGGVFPYAVAGRVVEVTEQEMMSAEPNRNSVLGLMLSRRWPGVAFALPPAEDWPTDRPPRAPTEGQREHAREIDEVIRRANRGG